MELHIADTDFSVEALKVQAENTTHGAIDIETTIGNPWKEGEVEVVSVAVTFDGWRAWVFRDDEFLQAARPILEHNDFVMHNGLFDRLIMKQIKGFDIPLKHDTMAMQYLLDPDGQGRGIFRGDNPNSLETVSNALLGLSDYKDVDYQNILDEPWEKVAEMNGEDVCRTFNLWRPLADQLNEDKQLLRIYSWLLMPAVNELIEVTLNGIPLDQARLTALTDSVSQHVGQLLDELRAVTPDPDPETYGKDEWKGRKRKADPPPPFNPGSPEQVRHVLFDLWKLPILEYTKKDGEETTTPSTNKDVLLRLEVEHTSGQKEDWVAKLRKYREVNKLLTSYLNSWPELVGDDRRLHPRYKPLHVVTGRLSSDQPNIQNVPRKKEYRSVFGGEDGYTWLKADYSQIELRVAAWLAGEETMLEAYRNGDDLHALTARTILGVDDVTQEVKAGTSARDVGKVLNFGLLYGAGPTTLQYIARTNYDVFFTYPEAKMHRENFFWGYPALAEWHTRMKKQLEWTGQVRSPLGRIRYLPKAKIPWEVEDMRGHKIHAILEGTNHPVQSMASDMLLMSMVRVAPLVKPLGVQIVAEVHDEIDFLVPNEHVEEVGQIVKATMEDVAWLGKFGINLTVPVVADIETGPYWGEVT